MEKTKWLAVTPMGGESRSTLRRIEERPRSEAAEACLTHRSNIGTAMRGKRLLAESSSLLKNLEQSFERLRETHRAKRELIAGKPGGAKGVREKRERELYDSPDMVDALRQATQILEMDFTGPKAAEAKHFRNAGEC